MQKHDSYCRNLFCLYLFTKRVISCWNWSLIFHIWSYLKSDSVWLLCCTLHMILIDRFCNTTVRFRIDSVTFPHANLPHLICSWIRAKVMFWDYLYSTYFWFASLQRVILRFIIFVWFICCFYVKDYSSVTARNSKLLSLKFGGLSDILFAQNR